MAELMHEEWAPCPPGELTRLGSRLRARRHLRLAIAWAIAALVSAGVALGAYQAATSDMFSGGESTSAPAPCH
jgi:hypothetical protein